MIDQMNDRLLALPTPSPSPGAASAPEPVPGRDDTPVPGQAPARRQRVSLLADVRGSALSEALIMIPFFIIVWGCLMFVHERYIKKIAAGSLARSCAYRHANDACEGDVPQGCALARGEDVEAAGFDEQDPGVIDQLRNSLPFLGPLFEAVFGHDVTASVSKNVQRPTLIGGGTGQTTGFVTVMCNEKRRELSDLVKAATCDLIGDSINLGGFCD